MRRFFSMTGWLALASVGLLALTGCDGETSTPTSTPASTPAAQPGVRAAGPAQLLPPLHDAEEGEWVTYVRGTGDGEHLVQIRVIGTADMTVTVEQTTYVGGRPQGRPTTLTWHRNGFGVPEGGVIRAIERDHIMVKDALVPCWRMRVHSRHDIRLYWISEQYPVHGVIQIDRVVKGQPEGNPFRVREFGFSDE